MAASLRARWRSLAGVALAAAAAVAAGSAWHRHLAGQARGEVLRRGERLYREGLQSWGAPTRALVRGDIGVDGAMFSCVGCHRVSGLGAREGRVVAPPITGDNLFAPVKVTYKGVEVQGEPPRRPAYTHASLAKVLRTGVDPSGRVLDEAMPRYELTDEQVEALIAHLEALSDVPSPGVEDDRIHLATVISGDSSAEERQALLGVLEKYVALKNGQVQPKETGIDNRSARMATQMLQAKDLAFKRLVLTTWVLEGPPQTWRAQLEAYEAADPPFALVSGLARGPWAPIHSFSEERRIPCLLPVTELPEVFGAGSYTLYLSLGFFQEGDGAARFLLGQTSTVLPRTVVQVVREAQPERALATGFERTWRELGQPPPVTLGVERGDPLPLAALARASRGEAVTAVVWDSQATPAELAAYAAVPGVLAVLASGTFVGEGALELPAAAREAVYFTWRSRLPLDERAYAGRLEPWLGKEARADGGAPPGSRSYQVASGANVAALVLTDALMGLRGHYSREYLLDVVGMMKDQDLPGYERLSFGPGQRALSKGCYVVQVTAGEAPTFVKRSAWLTH